MNEMIALDPGVAHDLESLRLLRGKVGFYEGRFISRFPRNWYARALEIAKSINSDIDHKLVLESLTRLRDKALLPSGREYNGGISWHDNAVISNKVTSFDLMISEVPANGFKTIIEIDDKDDWLNGRGKFLSPGTTGNLLSAMSPLLTTSGSLYLIDPHFDPDSGLSKDLFRQVLTKAFSNNCLSLTIIRSSKDWSKPGLKIRMQDILNNLGIKGKQLRFRVAHDRGTLDQQHARFIFSERGGLSLDRGLQTTRSAYPIAWIDKATHDELYNKYAERPLPFELMEDIRINS